MYAYVAPFRNQAKRVAWEYLKYYTSPIPSRTVNESELYIELPSRHARSPGARLYIIGADHPDALRGIYLDGVILDEYADIKPELWDGVIRSVLSDRAGWAVFIHAEGTESVLRDVPTRGEIGGLVLLHLQIGRDGSAPR